MQVILYSGRKMLVVVAVVAAAALHTVQALENRHKGCNVLSVGVNSCEKCPLDCRVCVCVYVYIVCVCVVVLPGVSVVRASVMMIVAHSVHHVFINYTLLQLYATE